MLPHYIIGPGGKWWQCERGWGDPTPPRDGVASCQIAADGYDKRTPARDYASREDLEAVMAEHREIRRLVGLD